MYGVLMDHGDQGSNLSAAIFSLFLPGIHGSNLSAAIFSFFLPGIHATSVRKKKPQRSSYNNQGTHHYAIQFNLQINRSSFYYFAYSSALNYMALSL